MSRTPKREIHKLPLWVQQELTKRSDEIADLLLEIERLDDACTQLEEANEALAKRGEENAQQALGTHPFELRVVDL